MAEGAPSRTLSRDEPLTEAVLGELMVRYQQADSIAPEVLVHRLSPPLLRFLAQPSFTRSQSEDLLQECWLRIHKARHTYRPGAPVLPWIYAIARHTRLDGYRRYRRIQIRETSIEERGDVAGRPHESAGTVREDLSQALDGLTESQREVILMLKVVGMSLEEVARATSSTVGAVKQKAHRAYESLRRILGRTRQ